MRSGDDDSGSGGIVVASAVSIGSGVGWDVCVGVADGSDVLVKVGDVSVAVAGIDGWQTNWENVSLYSLEWAPWARIQYKGQNLDFRRHLPFMIHCIRNNYDVVHGHLYLYLRWLRCKKKIAHFHTDPIGWERNPQQGVGLSPKDFSTIAANSDVNIASRSFRR